MTQPSPTMVIPDRAAKVRLRDVVRKLWPALRPYRQSFGAGLFLIVLSTFVEVVMPIVVGTTVDVVIAPAHDLAHLYRLCFIFLGLVLAKSIIEASQAYIISSTGQAVTHDLRTMLFSRIEALPVGYFDRNPTGRLLTRVVNDIKSLSELFTASMSVIALDAMIIVGTVFAMFWMHAKLAGAVLLTFPLVLLSVRYFGEQLATCYRSVRVRLAEINAFLGENISAIATIQRLAAEEERFRTFNQITDGYLDAQMNSVRTFAMVQPVTNILNGVAMSTLILLGGYWVVQGKITVGLVVAFLGYVRNLFQPVRDLVEKYNNFLSATVSAERVVGILDEKTEWEGEPGRVERLATNPISIRFSNVSVRYPTRERLALESVSFDLPAGRSLAVVGATGGGKSTLIRLLLRFYEPVQGEIQFAGRPLSQWNKADLRSHIGVVHQEIYLFQGTVRDNLTLGQVGFDDEELLQACKRAQLWEFIECRGGLDMQVLEGGTNFSLGERQLISFARILVFNPPVFVLDEATSSVDRLLERRLMEAIRETTQGRTSIVIAHRLSTIQRCDSIIVIEKGHLQEEGTYSELLRGNGIFARFHEIHNST